MAIPNQNVGRPTSTGRPDPREPPGVRNLLDVRRLPVHSVSGRAHVSLRPHLPLHGPRLYILLHLHHLRISVGLAHLRDRALLIHIGSTPRERPQPLRRRSLWIQDLLAEKNIKTSSRRRPATLVSSLVDRVPCELLCIRGSSTCVTILCWFSDSPVFSLVFHLVLPLCSSCTSRDLLLL